jgi:hypothetical protein
MIHTIKIILKNNTPGPEGSSVIKVIDRREKS